MAYKSSTHGLPRRGERWPWQPRFGFRIGAPGLYHALSPYSAPAPGLAPVPRDAPGRMPANMRDRALARRPGDPPPEFSGRERPRWGLRGNGTHVGSGGGPVASSGVSRRGGRRAPMPVLGRAGAAPAFVRGRGALRPIKRPKSSGFFCKTGIRSVPTSSDA